MHVRPPARLHSRRGTSRICGARAQASLFSTPVCTAFVTRRNHSSWYFAAGPVVSGRRVRPMPVARLRWVRIRRCAARTSCVSIRNSDRHASYECLTNEIGIRSGKRPIDRCGQHHEIRGGARLHRGAVSHRDRLSRIDRRSKKSCCRFVRLARSLGPSYFAAPTRQR